MRIAVLGATGHTGHLVVRALRARGADVLACGRDEAALRRLADAGVETLRADVRSRADVERALAGAAGVANLAGPFLATGLLPPRVAVERRVPYVDTTGEQAFLREVQRLDAPAREARVPLVGALAYEYAFADLAARVLWPGGGDELHVLYRARLAQGSLGTKRTMLRVLAAPSLGREDGETRPVPFARFSRDFPTDDGPRTGVSFPGGEILTVPRHTPFRTIRTYAPAPPARARAMRWAAPAAGALLRAPGAMRLAERVVAARHRPPRNEGARGEVHLVAVRDGREERAVVRVPDPYVATAELAAEGVVRLAKAGGAGALAPAEAFDASPMLESMRATLPGFSLSRA